MFFYWLSHICFPFQLSFPKCLHLVKKVLLTLTYLYSSTELWMLHRNYLKLFLSRINTLKYLFLSTYSNIVMCNQSHVMNVKQGVKIKTVFQFLTWTVIKKTMCI